MGITYKAFDTRLRVDVVLKIIRQEMLSSERARHLFLREARAAAKVRHPNVAAVLTLHDEEPFYYAMEFVAGHSLAEFLKGRSPLPVAEALDYTDQVAAALSAVSREHIVHRDLKPANIMVVADDERPFGNLLKVIDFGLAKGFRVDNVDPETHLRSLTNWQGGFSGTVAYASPEQCGELPDIDGRSDLYSLGVVVWQMLTGKLPFSGRLAQMAAMHQHKEPPWDQLAAVPAPVVDLLRKLLAKEREDRFVNARELRVAIGSVVATLGSDGDWRQAIRALAPGHVEEADTQALSTAPDTVRLGTTLAERFTVGEIVAEGDGGTLFKAVDNGGGGALVAMKLLPAGRNSDDAFCERLRDELDRVRRKSPGVFLEPVSSLLRSGDSTFYVREWATGFSLEELLRVRGGELRAPEVWRLLRELPGALDEAAAENLTLAEPLLRKLFVCPPAGAANGQDWPSLRSRSIADWPEFRLRWNSVSVRPTNGGQSAVTVTQMTDQNVSATEDRVRALALLLRELLGGRIGTITPLTGLGDEANAVLQRATVAGGGLRAFASARELWDAFPKSTTPPASPQRDSSAGPASFPDSGSPAGREGHALPSNLESGKMPPRAGGRAGVVAGAAALLFVAGIAAMFVWRYQAPPPPTTLAVASQTTSPPAVPAASPSALPAVVPPPAATNVPVATPLVAPTPAPQVATIGSAKAESTTAAAGASPNQSPVPLPAAAQEALNKGLNAVQQKEASLAIRYFEDARKAAPYAPQVLSNLASAESQIPGREARAIAWLEASLVASPPLDRNSAARSQIAGLELKMEANAGQVITMLKQLAGGFAAGSGEANGARQAVGVVQAHAGDAEAAVATAQQLLASSAGSIPSIVSALAEEGQFDLAKRIAGQIGDNFQRSIAYSNILSQYAKRDRLDEARSTLASITEEQIQRGALYELAKAEFKAGDTAHAQQRLARASEMVKAMKNKDPSEVSSRSSALDQLAREHLEVGDWRGALALLPLIANAPNHAIHDSAQDYMAERMAALCAAESTKGNWAAAETLADSIPAVDLRAGMYANIARQPDAKSNPDRLASLSRKTESLLAKAPRAREKLFVASAVSDISSVRGEAAASARWRTQALGFAAPALQEPDAVRMDFRKILGGNLIFLERLRRFYIARELDRICSGAITAGDDAGLRKVAEIARAGLPKTDEYSRRDLLEALRKALFALASRTRSPGDVTALVKYTQDFPKMTPASDLQNTANKLGEAGDDASAQTLLNAILDAAERTKAINEYAVRKFGRQFDEAIKKSDFAAAAHALAQLPEGTDRISRQLNLLGELAGEGDFAGAGNIVASITDGSQRLSAQGRLTSERADAGDTSASLELWQQKRSLLAGITDPTRRLDLFWQLAGGAETPALARELVPPFFLEARALPEPSKRAEQLRWVMLAAKRAGLYPTHREARAGALGLPGIGKWLSASSLNSLEFDSGECLEQASGPWRDYYLGTAVNRLAAAGDTAAAQKLATQLSGTFADAAQLTLAKAFADRGDFAATRAAQEKIVDKSARSNAAQLVVHAFLMAGNATAAKEFAEQNWPVSDSEGSDLLKEMANAGEIVWALANLKRLGTSYSPGARVAVTAVQIAKGDLSTAESVFAACTYDYDRLVLVRTAADAGQFDLALKWMKASNVGRNEIIAAKVRAGDLAGARALADQLTRNKERVGARRVLASAQAKAGDTEGSRATFRDASKMDQRTSAKFDTESFVGTQLVGALITKPDFPAALAVASAIHDETSRSRVLATIAVSAAAKDSVTTEEALKAIGDPLARSLAASATVNSALRQKQPKAALTFAGFAVDEGFRALCLGALLSYGIDHGDVADVVPQVLALKDPVSLARLATDALRGRAYREVKVDEPSLIAAAESALSAIPPGYQQALLVEDFSRAVTGFDSVKGLELRNKAAALSAQLTGEDAAERDREIARSVAASASVAAAKTEDPQEKERNEVIDQWSRLVTNNLAEPIFTDFRATLDNLPNSAPAGAANRAWTVFGNVSTQASKLVDALKQIRAKRAELAAKVAAPAGNRK